MIFIGLDTVLMLCAGSLGIGFLAGIIVVAHITEDDKKENNND